MMMERTSGSTGGSKLIPFTAELRREFSDATAPWLSSLYQNFPRLKSLKSFWSISQAGRQRQFTSGGIPIGFEDETEYFHPIVRWMWKRLLAVPSTLAREPDTDVWRQKTALHLLGCEDLGLISVWSPTFLSRLIDHIEATFSQLVPKLPPARQRALSRALPVDGSFRTSALWPHLQVISCWCDGPSAQYTSHLRGRFPDVPLEPKGLLTTEGAVTRPATHRSRIGALSFPVGAVPAIEGDFLEFMAADALDGNGNLHAPVRTFLASELEPGGAYCPIISTGGGFYRYLIRDELRCVGYLDQLPLLRFVGKRDRVSDLCGEKLTAAFVDRCFSQLTLRAPGLVEGAFLLLVPVSSAGESAHYAVITDRSELLEGHVRRVFLKELDQLLRENYHYDLARNLNQLAEMELLFLKGGFSVFEDLLVSLGMRRGDIKPCFLETRQNVAERLLNGAGGGPHPDPTD